MFLLPLLAIFANGSTSKRRTVLAAKTARAHFCCPYKTFSKSIRATDTGRFGQVHCRSRRKCSCCHAIAARCRRMERKGIGRPTYLRAMPPRSHLSFPCSHWIGRTREIHNCVWLSRPSHPLVGRSHCTPCESSIGVLLCLAPDRKQVDLVCRLQWIWTQGGIARKIGGQIRCPLQQPHARTIAQNPAPQSTFGVPIIASSSETICGSTNIGEAHSGYRIHQNGTTITTR